MQVPVTFIYGETDWMDPKGGARVCKEIRQERGQLTPADLLVTSIPQAGHYPFLDQPDLFMKALLEQTKPYRYASLKCSRETTCQFDNDRQDCSWPLSGRQPFSIQPAQVKVLSCQTLRRKTLGEKNNICMCQDHHELDSARPGCFLEMLQDVLVVRTVILVHFLEAETGLCVSQSLHN